MYTKIMTFLSEFIQTPMVNINNNDRSVIAATCFVYIYFNIWPNAQSQCQTFVPERFFSRQLTSLQSEWKGDSHRTGERAQLADKIN